MKERLKQFLLRKLHAVPRQEFDIMEAIVTKGIPGACSLDYERFKSEILNYIKGMNVGGFAYKYAASRQTPCLYASLYAVMTEGLFGVLKDRTAGELKIWADYINSFQNPDDGLYYDPALLGDSFEHIGIWGEGWGKHHLMGHVIIALARLGHKPKYKLTYLEQFYDIGYLKKWLEGLNFYDDVWSASNYIMNLYTVLQYSRDYLYDSKAAEPINFIKQWLLERQNNTTGLWHKEDWNSLDQLHKLFIVRGAYHYFPLYVYDEDTVPHAGKIVRSILPLQNSWGGWTKEGNNSGACEDIDAIEPLIRFAGSAPELKKQIDAVVRRSLAWQMATRNADGGFSFYVRSQQEYGGHPVTTSLRDESSMFATWFRTLCIAYEMQYLGMPNDFNLGHFPGYEINL